MAVRDVERMAAFYTRVLGALVVYREAGFVQLQTPGSWDVLVFEERPSDAGRAGSVLHFGFRLLHADDIGDAEAAVIAAGGRITEKGAFVPGEPYLFATDPEGNAIELWYELPTPVDPKGPGALPSRSRRRRRRSSPGLR